MSSPSLWRPQLVRAFPISHHVIYRPFQTQICLFLLLRHSTQRYEKVTLRHTITEPSCPEASLPWRGGGLWGAKRSSLLGKLLDFRRLPTPADHLVLVGSKRAAGLAGKSGRGSSWLMVSPGHCLGRSSVGGEDLPPNSLQEHECVTRAAEMFGLADLLHTFCL